MSDPRQSQYFADNLRTLCSGPTNISELCRKIGINRTQFNKYVAGHHIPSKENINSIARYFKIDETALFTPPFEFRSYINSEKYKLANKLSRLKRFNQLSDVYANTRHLMVPFHGVYHRYHYSSIYHGRVLRSVLAIYEIDELSVYSCVERFQNRDNPNRADYIFKYHGICHFNDDKIIFCDFEALQKNELTFAIMTPVRRSAKRFMFGITTGIAANVHREPYTTRVALSFVEHGLIKRHHLRSARALLPEDATIPSDVRDFLNDGPRMIRA